MEPVREADITGPLRALTSGHRGAVEEIMPVLYKELHRIASSYMRRERGGHTLQTTALVNEAYLRLADGQQLQWQDRAHFFALAAQVMRRILVDHARSRGYLKHGGAVRRVSLDEAMVVAQSRRRELVELDDALNDLGKLDARKAQVVETRFFGGLSVDETAAVLGFSPQTVARDWKLSKIWLTRQMSRAAK